MRNIHQEIIHAFRFNGEFKVKKAGCFMYHVYTTYEGGRAISYWNTIVAHQPAGARHLVLNSDGNRTATTKATINAALAAVSSPFTLVQKKGEWWLVADDTKPVLFFDGISVSLSPASVYAAPALV